ncbi:MAG: hypothetical protein GTO54_07090 [Nitrososphaeria archaeon]|nr:hypothetical protein [Nitrososphaeria archaeon]
MSTTPSKTETLVFSVVLFLIVFGIWQAYDLILANFMFSALAITIITYFVIYAICISIFALFVKLGKSSFKEHGFKEPSRPKTHIPLSIFFVLVYIIVMLMPAFLFGFTQRSPPSFLGIIFDISRALLISLTTESIFRGYIFRNLTKNQGFFIALYASSIMFGLHGYEYPVSIMNLLAMSSDEIITEILFPQILPAFTGGLFLGYMFYKMDWSLVGPIIFRTGTLLYFSFTPFIASSPWWMAITFEVMAYACLFVIVDSAIKEPRYRRRRFGLE